MTPTNSCSCLSCQSACKRKPGWFRPGEAEKAAELMAMPLKDFFDNYLGVDWYEKLNKSFVLSPAIKSMDSGGMFPFIPTGECIFFENGLCKIHEAKPFDCANYIHNTPRSETDKIHFETGQAWVSHQQQIKDLLGKDPFTPEPTAVEMFHLLGHFLK